MEYDKLIDLIVSEVYNKINQLPSIQKSSNKKAVVFWADDLVPYDILKNIYDIVPYTQEVKECDIIIVSKLCLRGLYNLAQGNSVSEEERFILKMLMRGKKVYVLNEGMEYKKYKMTAPKMLYNKYIKCEEDLKGFGVKIIKEPSEVITDEPDNEMLPLKCETDAMVVEKEFQIRNKKVISEVDLRKPRLGQLTTIVIDKNSIITPLANDFIRINHLKIKRM